MPCQARVGVWLMPSTSRRSRSPAFGRVSVHSSSDGNDDGTNSDSDVGSDVSTSSVSSTSSADTIQQARREVMLVSTFWVLYFVFCLCPELVWYGFWKQRSKISSCKACHLRPSGLTPHVKISALQARHVSGWGRRLAHQAGNLVLNY